MANTATLRIYSFIINTDRSGVTKVMFDRGISKIQTRKHVAQATLFWCPEYRKYTATHVKTALLHCLLGYLNVFNTEALYNVRQLSLFEENKDTEE